MTGHPLGAQLLYSISDYMDLATQAQLFRIWPPLSSWHEKTSTDSTRMHGMSTYATIRPTAEGIGVEVQVIPRARRAGLDGARAGAVLVRLQSAPVDGAANKELIGVIAEALGVSRAAVTIVSGERSRRKRVHVAGVSVAEADLKLGTRHTRLKTRT